MRADGFARQPIVRMTNVNLEPGDAGTLEDLIAATDSGIYMETNRSWSIDQRRLHFQFGTEIAWEIKDGKRGRMLRNPTYAGVTPEFWAGLDAICSPPAWRSGACSTAARASPASRCTSRTAPPRRASATCRWASRDAAALELAERALEARARRATARSPLVTSERSLMLRFARSRPTQATAIEDATISIAVAARRPRGRRVHEPRPTTTSLAACARAAETAAEASRAHARHRRLPGLPAAAAARARTTASTRPPPRSTPRRAAARWRPRSRCAERHGVEAHGIWTAGDVETAIASSTRRGRVATA